MYNSCAVSWTCFSSIWFTRFMWRFPFVITKRGNCVETFNSWIQFRSSTGGWISSRNELRPLHGFLDFSIRASPFSFGQSHVCTMVVLKMWFIKVFFRVLLFSNIFLVVFQNAIASVGPPFEEILAPIVWSYFSKIVEIFSEAICDFGCPSIVDAQHFFSFEFLLWRNAQQLFGISPQFESLSGMVGIQSFSMDPKKNGG
jgi:hypothetical protein